MVSEVESEFDRGTEIDIPFGEFELIIKPDIYDDTLN